MAQIIKHRRGSLESVSSATKRAGELLVVTGSAGITAANGDSLLFLGVDGSTVTPANKVLQGTTVPNLTGASYDTSVDGIPFYDTSAQKLYILNKGGNVEVKATANTGGTNIVSSSAQISGYNTFLEINGDSVVSSSAQVIGHLGGSGIVSSSAQIDNLFDIDGLVSTSAQIDALGFLQVNGDSVVSSSAQISGYNTFLEINGDSVVSGSSQIDLTSTTNYVSGIKTRLNAEGVISGSSQVQIDSVTGFTAFSSSIDSRTDALEAAVGEGSNIDGRLTALESFSGSQETKDATLATYTASVDQNLTAIHSYTSSLKTAISTSGANLTVLGNLEVQGTTTTVDSTTISLGDNIIELNGSGAANGGLLVKDVTAPNTVSGSLLWDSTNDYWKAGALGSELKLLRESGDGVVSGSAQITLTDADNTSFDTSYVAEHSSRLYFTDARVKTKLNAEGVISGSSQVQLASVSGFTAHSSSVDSRLDTLEATSGDLANTYLEINGDGVHSGSAQVVSALLNQTVDFGTGDISGSNLNLTGNANIDGNIVLGGNITIGDASSDTISFGGEVASDIIPSANNTYDLGSSTDKFAEIHATTIYGSISATNGVISGSAQLLNVATDFGTGRVSGDNFGDAAGTSTFTGSFVGDGSGLTGLATDLVISGSTGNDVVDLLNDALSVVGSTGVTTAVTNNTITVSGTNASTSAKGVASFDADDFSVASGNVSIKSGGVRAANLNADVAGTGISLNGVDNSVEVDYGATAGTAVEGNTSLTVQGTSNEIEVSGGSVTLGNGGTVTVGLPSDVTIGNDLTVTTDLSVGGNVEITGNLSVLGTTTTIDSTTVQIGDNILELNIGGAQSTAGLQVTDATAPNTVSGSLLWDGTNDYWKGGALGSEKEFARLNTAPTSNTVLKANADGLLVDSLLTDDGTNVTISGTAELRINAATANSFVYFDANKSLEAVTPSNAGDVIQWNGSSFVASNEIDGGTF